MTQPEKQCHACSRMLPLNQFNKDKSRQSGIHHECKDCCSRTSAWPYKAYASVHGFDRLEEYVIGRLAKQPSLSAKLDTMYRRNPRRWHQLIAAAMIMRREQQSA